MPKGVHYANVVHKKRKSMQNKHELTYVNTGNYLSDDRSRKVQYIDTIIGHFHTVSMDDP